MPHIDKDSGQSSNKRKRTDAGDTDVTDVEEDGPHIDLQHYAGDDEDGEDEDDYVAPRKAKAKIGGRGKAKGKDGPPVPKKARAGPPKTTRKGRKPAASKLPAKATAAHPNETKISDDNALFSTFSSFYVRL